MASARKVQAEIDKLFKKAQDGLSEYEEIYEKFETAMNLSNKERLEADLKRELKKLQRQREAIKGYVANPDVKDTKQLEEYRRRIEEKMTEFKDCERMMKTKAFSREGLAVAAELETGSPMAVTTGWLRTAIDDGRKRLEILEYEAQRTKAGRKAKKEQKSEAQVRLEKTVDHIHRWEALLRMLSNEEVEPEEVDDLRDDVDKVLDEETPTDEVPDVSMYEDFDIAPPRPRSADSAEASPTTPSERPPVSASAKALAKKTPPSTTVARPVAPAAAVVAVAKPEERKEAAAAPPTPAAASPKERGPLPTSLDGEFTAEQLTALDGDMDGANDDTFGDDAMGGAAAAGSLADMASATSKGLGGGGGPNDWESRKLDLKKRDDLRSPAGPKAATAAAATAAAPTLASPLSAESKSPSAPVTNDWEKRKLDLKKGTATAAAAAAPEAHPEKAAPAPAPAPAAAAAVSPAVAAAPAPTTSAPASSPTHPNARHDALTMHRMLDMSLGNLPHTLDVERQRAYEPPNAIEPIPYFPQEVHPVLASRDVYRELDLETLFFIFYYHQKSYQQYFAAKELKARSFRYHTEEKRWYQRREKPRETTGTSESGAYTYFDFEDSWQRKEVEDFKFEYRFLEDDLN